ncbi:MAG TPA: hypothetical protein VJR25_16545 [Microbacterium sp.]|uniref:hypothetical protein n=1 Tax=Microbacterium sp. TaxID=51671 RepID=UPI002B466CF9|nr:hypothetical protein [Microbacterium sp.]HKT58373.1 hypothetical protein [Microbacterium sp.]
MAREDETARPVDPYWRYYLKSWYWVIPVMMPIAASLKGFTWPESAWTVRMGLAISLGWAWFTRGRLVMAAAYVPPAVGAPLSVIDPAARIAPDQLHRSRGRGVLGWGLLVISLIVVVSGFVWLVGSDDSGVVAEVAVSVASVAWMLFAIFFIMTRPVIARGARVAADHPRDVVVSVVVSAGDDLGRTLAKLAGPTVPPRRQGVPSLSTVLVDDRGLSFWKGWTQPHEQYLVPWKLIGPVTAAPIQMDAAHRFAVRIGVEVMLRATEDDGTPGWVTIGFVPTRNNLFMVFPHRSEIAESVASEIESRRRGRRDLFTGLTTA